MANANTAVEHGAEAGGAAMPQLDPTTFSNQIFWLLITLFVIYMILSRIALPRISSALAERAGTINNNIASAEEFKQKAAQAEQAYNQALADARTEAAKIVQDAKTRIQQDLAAELAKADERIAEKMAEGEKEIAEIRQDALQSVKLVATDTASALLVALGGNDDKAAIEKSIAGKLKG